MMDPYADEGEHLMSRATDLPTPTPQPRAARPDLRGKHVCPFCGAVNPLPDGEAAAQAGPCPRCSMSDTPATRKATKARIGPWFVRQTRNPAAPGMRFDTLLALVRRGQVMPQSVVRGPTTHQLWRFAANVKGLSRAFGLCYSCGGSVEPDATLCPHCNRMQEPPANPDMLLEGGLAPAAAGEHQPVRKEIRPIDPRPIAPHVPSAAPTAREQPDDIFTTSHEHPLEDLQHAAMEHRAESAPRPPRRDDRAPKRRDQRELERRDERELERRDERALQRRDEPEQPPARQRATPSTDNAILSARDLAAAFQLDFQPKKRRRRKWVGKLVTAVVLLALGGGAAMLVLNENWRRSSLAWGQQQYTSIREAVVSRVQAPPVPDRPAAPAVANAERPSEIASPRANVAGRDLAPPPSAGIAPPVTRPVILPATRPVLAAATNPAPPVAIAAPAPRVEAPRTPPPAPAASNQPPPAPIDPAVAAEQARTLWRQAIDAEAERDFAAAVAHYEQIKRLPKNVWPGGLEINLELARKRLQ